MGTDKELSDLLDFSMVSGPLRPPPPVVSPLPPACPAVHTPAPPRHWERSLCQKHCQHLDLKLLWVKEPQVGLGELGRPRMDGLTPPRWGAALGPLSASRGTRRHPAVCPGTEWVQPTTLQLGKLRSRAREGLPMAFSFSLGRLGCEAPAWLWACSDLAL